MKITFETENKAKNDYDYPKLYLEYGERARIVCIEANPEMEFVHNLRAPAIVNGEIVMETIKTKDGTTQKPKMDFVGKHLCFGSPEKLQKDQKDPASCPTCAAANQYDYVGPAVRRFAMHVVQYRIQPQGFKPQTPFQAELVVWTFADKVFNTITDIHEEHGDLRAKDLLLGPCENKGFQKFDIQIGGTAAWLQSDDTKKFVTTLYAENKTEDLIPLIARKVSREMAQDDIERVLTKHAQAFGGAMPEAETSGTNGAAAMSLDSMLSGPSETPNEKPLETPSLDVSAFTPEPEAPKATEPEPVVAATAYEPVPEKPAASLDFEKLLEGL